MANDLDRDDGGQAFPCAGPLGHDGMSLRDYIAASALEGYLASFGDDTPHPATVTNSGTEQRDQRVKAVATMSYILADAMLAARRA